MSAERQLDVISGDIAEILPRCPEKIIEKSFCRILRRQQPPPTCRNKRTIQTIGRNFARTFRATFPRAAVLALPQAAVKQKITSTT